MYSKNRSDEKEFIMGTHIAGVLPKYCAGCQRGFFGRGKVEHVLCHVWTLIWKVLYGSQKQLPLSWCGSRSFRNSLTYAHCKLPTFIRDFVACWGLTYSQVTWSRKVFFFRLWGLCSFSEQRLQCSIHTHVNLKWWLPSQFWKLWTAVLLCLVRQHYYWVTSRHISLYGQTFFPGICAL